MNLDLSILASLGAAAASFALAKRESTDKVGRRLNGIIFVASLGAAFGAFQQSQEQAAFERELRQRTDTILANVTGGESYCYLTAVGAGPVGALVVFNQGETPLYELEVLMTDLDLLDRLTEKHGRAARIEDASQKYVVGMLAPNTAATLDEDWASGSDTSRGFYIRFSARNGTFYESLRVRSESGEWTRAVRVEKDEKLLFEKVDPTFPKIPDGEVDWSWR